MTDSAFTGIDELRGLVRLCGNCTESFNQAFSAEQLVKLYRAYRLSAWDITPDRWSERQLTEALEHGTPPDFNDDETPKVST